MTNLVNIYLVYRILRLFTTPFNEWNAFKTGVIDAEGNIIVPQEKRTTAQDESFTKFDLLILKLKRVLEKLPFGKTRLASFAAALYLLKEENNLTGDEDVGQLFLEHYHQGGFDDSMMTYLEEEIANVVGSGAIAGTDENPPMGKKAQAAFIRRFANNDVFVVDTQRFNQARLGKKKYLKYEKYVGNDEVGDAIRQYGRKYPKRPIILQDDKTNAMIFLRYGRSGMFTESFAPEVVTSDITIVNEEVTMSDLKKVEQYADKLFKAIGIDVGFTRHFLDRVNDERNRKQITTDELTALFKKTFEKHGKRIPKLGPDAEAVINDMQSDINMPFVLKWDRDSEELDLVAKTVMRKKNFMTSNQKLTV
jgi:hypothetical protein